VLIGGSDAYVGRQPCQDYAAKFKAQGADIETKVYSGAQHDWDVPVKSWTEARGENWSNCRFVEQQDGSWIEQTSGIATHAAGARPLPGRAEAIKKCMTYGVSGGYDASTARQSLGDIQGFVKAALRL
jgi:dienelactone hydrolase